MKKWLLREQPQEKLDIRLWQTFRNIDLQTAIKLHEERPSSKQPAGAITAITTAPNSPKLLAVINSPTTNHRKTSILPIMFVYL